MPGTHFCYVLNNFTVLRFPVGESLLYSKAYDSQRNEGAKVIGGKQQIYRQDSRLQQMLRSFSKSFTAPEIMQPFAAMQKQKNAAGKVDAFVRTGGK
jgi:hypothetical protein